jgi:hypothetical protein
MMKMMYPPIIRAYLRSKSKLANPSLRFAERGQAGHHKPSEAPFERLGKVWISSVLCAA